MGIKTHELLNSDGTHHSWLVRCPACDVPHSFDKRWTFNGNHEAPTFDPSIKIFGAVWDAEKQAHVRDDTIIECHSVLVDGVWRYGLDSSHAMKGQNVPAPDWDAT